MSEESSRDLCEAFLATSLPLDPNEIPAAAEKAVEFYRNAPERIALPIEEVADRFAELWGLWFSGDRDVKPSKELKDVVRESICINPNMALLAGDYFKLEDKLEEKAFMSRDHAVALIGCAPLIRTLVEEQHLGLDRIKAIINVPGATYDAIRYVLNTVGISAPFDVSSVKALHEADVDDVATYFGDTLPEEADKTLRGLLGSFSRSEELWESVTELVLIGFEPYLFMLYYELLTLETTDRFPGRAIYEHGPRSGKVKELWNSMYNPTQENPYLNNAKSVYSLDEAWAETKLSNETQNGSLMLADIFDIMSELPYTTRRRAARVVRCYLVLMANKNQAVTMLPDATPDHVRAFVRRVASNNSLTKGVLDQRLVDFLTMCGHRYEDWVVRGLGSSVNESNASGRKYGDVEFLDIKDRIRVQAYEAHGGGLRDEYVTDHIHSLAGTVEYYQADARDRGDKYERDVEIVYVAHDVSRLSAYRDGYCEMIHGIPFTFRFITFMQLVEESGGIDYVASCTNWFNELIHERISRLPDAYTLKKRYQAIILGE